MMASVPRNPRSRNPSPETSAVIPAEEGASVDPMEWVLAVIYAVAIPLVTYAVLSSVFSDGLSRAEEMERAEQIQNVRAPVTVREIQLRLDRIRPVLETNVPEFIKRARQQETPSDIHRVCRYAYRALGWSAAELEQVLDEIATSPEVRSQPEIEQEIRRYLAFIETEKDKVRKITPHPYDLPKDPSPEG